jgi:hypothetical protein
MIPNWIIQKRAQTCAKCPELKRCAVKTQLHLASMPCPLGLQKSAMDEIAAKAWPDGAPRASGCCDSMLHVAR